MTNKQQLHISNIKIRQLVESLVGAPGTSCDKRFVYYLLGATGVCVVPLTSFASELKGFRITLLERDEEKFRTTLATIAEAIEEYLAS